MIGLDDVSLKNVREARGDETPRFSATILLRGFPVAEIGNAGQGGCCDIHVMAPAGYAEVEDLARRLFPGIEPVDTLVYAMMDAADNKRAIDRAMRAGLAFILGPDDRENLRYSTLKLKEPRSVEAVVRTKAALRKRHPDIAFMDEDVELYRLYTSPKTETAEGAQEVVDSAPAHDDATQPNEGENETMKVKTIGARVALKTDAEQMGSVVGTYQDHAVKVAWDSDRDNPRRVKASLLAVIGEDEATTKKAPSAKAATAKAAPEKKAPKAKPDPKPAKAAAAKKAAPPAKKAAPAAKPEKRPKVEGKFVLADHTPIRSPHHARSETSSRTVLFHLDSGDPWNKTGRYSLCRTKLTKWEKVPGKVTVAEVCGRCANKAKSLDAKARAAAK